MSGEASLTRSSAALPSVSALRVRGLTEELLQAPAQSAFGVVAWAPVVDPNVTSAQNFLSQFGPED